MCIRLCMHVWVHACVCACVHTCVCRPEADVQYHLPSYSTLCWIRVAWTRSCWAGACSRRTLSQSPKCWVHRRVTKPTWHLCEFRSPHACVESDLPTRASPQPQIREFFLSDTALLGVLGPVDPFLYCNSILSALTIHAFFFLFFFFLKHFNHNYLEFLVFCLFTLSFLLVFSHLTTARAWLSAISLSLSGDLDENLGACHDDPSWTRIQIVFLALCVWNCSWSLTGDCCLQVGKQIRRDLFAIVGWHLYITSLLESSPFKSQPLGHPSIPTTVSQTW